MTIKILLVIALLIALFKWFLWKLNALAILRYLVDCGQELPDRETLMRCYNKVLKKRFSKK